MGVHKRDRWAVAGLFPFLLCCSASSTSGPSLEVLDTNQNLGKIKTEATHRVKVRIRNKGSEPLQINDVEAGCGCTRPSFPPTVAAGRDAVIEIEFSPDLLWSGPRTETLTIRSNDPLNPKATVKFAADLTPPINFNQTNPALVKFVPGRPNTFVLRGTPREGTNSPILEASVDDPRVAVRLASKGSESVVTATFGAQKVAGDIDARLKLKTGLTSVPWVEFHLRAEADGAPFVSPALPRARELKAGATGTRIATLSVNGRGATVQVLSANSDDPALELKVERADKSARTWVSVIYKGGWKPGSRKATVRIVTDHKTYPTIEVPVLANVVAG